MCSPDIVHAYKRMYNRFSTMTLCNLSTHEDCKATLVSSHGLPPLIEMLDGESDLVKRYAAMTLCNLSTLAANQVGPSCRPSITVRQMNYDCVQSITCFGRMPSLSCTILTSVSEILRSTTAVIPCDGVRLSMCLGVLIFSRMQLTFHTTRQTPDGASRLVQAMSAWSVNTRRALSRHPAGSMVIRQRSCMT